jgi:chorismate mutase/prephenate dehydrogenase
MAFHMDLEELRSRLLAIDRKIIDLVAERQTVVDEIGVVKRSEGRVTRDFGREKLVLDAARARALELGISGSLAEALIQLLIRSSLTNQEQASVRASGHGDGLKALVIGGAGQMGRWFSDFLDSQGFGVTVADPHGQLEGYSNCSDWRETADEFAVTVVAAPLGATAGILSDLATDRRQGLIFDIASLKSPVAKGLHELAQAGAQVTSVHPMFGPDTLLLSGRHVLFMDVGVPEATERARQLFASTMARQIEMDLDDHDRLIGFILGLSHALNIAFFTALAKSGEALPRLADLSSTTFDAQLDVAKRVAGESPELYFEIQSNNPHGMAPLRALAEAVESISEVVRTGDEQAFIQMMDRGRDYLARRR